MSGIFGDDSLGTTRAVSPLVAPTRRPAMTSSGAQVPQFQSAWWRFTITVNGQFAGKTFEQQLTDGQAKQMAQTVYSQNSAGKTGVKIIGEKRVGNSWVSAGVMAPLSGFGQLLSQQEIDCAALCSTFMLTFGGPAAVAMCAQRCQEMTATKTCFVPSVCVEVASKYPNLMSPELVKTYCNLPTEAQQGIDIQCNAIAANMANQTPPLPPPVTPPAPPPGPTPPFEPAEEPPAQEAGIGIGTLAIVGAVGIGAYLLLRKKGRR